MIGEIGGPDEADAARWCKDNMKKPIVGFIAGVTAPPGKRMGHAGALISGGADTADAKLAVMEECGFTVTRNPSEMGRLMKACCDWAARSRLIGARDHGSTDVGREFWVAVGQHHRLIDIVLWRRQRGRDRARPAGQLPPQQQNQGRSSGAAAGAIVMRVVLIFVAVELLRCRT